MEKQPLNNKLIVGRGSTAIYLVLNNRLKNKEVIIPANICYAVPFSVIYSGNLPVFVDIKDDYSGNTSLDLIKEKVNDNTGAIIFPYMYGNVTEDIIEIKEFCTNNNILLIEDCASAMGGTINGRPVGVFGDYSFFSTGHAKNVDLGNGGILFSDCDLKDEEKEYMSLPEYSENIATRQSVFSKTYRNLRNQNNFDEINKFFDKHEQYRDLFIYKLDNNLDIANSFSVIEDKREKSMNNYFLYKDLLSNCNILEHYDGSFPWRFSIYIKDLVKRQKIINDLLCEELFVSDWYPCISNYFNDDSIYANAKQQGEEILNFSLDISQEDIRKICTIVNTNL